MRALARVGLVARGVIYLLIGWIALLIAFGRRGRQANQVGALHLLASKPYGQVLLWLLGIGFVCYALWRLTVAALGSAEEGRAAGTRLRALAGGIVYAFFAYLTFQVLSGVHANQARQEQDVTAQVMHHTGGRIVVGAIGIAVVVGGVVLVVGGIRRAFMKHLRTGQMSATTLKVVRRLGIVGTVARGAVFALVGALIVDAAATHKASKSGGLDKALLTLRHQVFGQALLVIVALGLIAFGAYALCEARWRRT